MALGGPTARSSSRFGTLWPLRHASTRAWCSPTHPSGAERVETERFRVFTYDEVVTRDKANLDITWLKDPSLDGGGGLLPPEVIAQEIVEDLEAALSEFAAIAEALQKRPGTATAPETQG